MHFKSFINADKLVILDFVFATCPTICPILSAGMASFQKKMGPDAEHVRLVTLTIDPEYDTPEILKQYSENYYAQKGWTFFTGSKRDIEMVMRTFDAYVADKMDHLPLTLLHPPGGKNWIRINDLMSTSELSEILAQCCSIHHKTVCRLAGNVPPPSESSLIPDTPEWIGIYISGRPHGAD